jgi:hypothetical protein
LIYRRNRDLVKDLTANKQFVYYSPATYEIPQDEHRRSTAEDIKGLILEKAIARFAQYGFGKATLVEIARD